MNDRELLELAAKAWIRSGMRLECPDDDDGIYVCRDQSRNGHTWNPLTDDGDALRLAAQLGMIVDVRYGERMKEMQCHNRVTYWVTPSNGKTVDCNNPGSDNLASIRRAIVCAAAEIGMAMP